MKIQVNTDKNIDGKERLAEYVKSLIEEGLGRYNESITRIEVHLSDENGVKNAAADKRCLIEAKIENLPAIAVTEVEETIHKAVDGAVRKMKKSIEAKLGKQNK